MNLGRVNFRFGRVQGHFARLQWIMISWLFMADLKTRYGISFFWGLLIFPAFLVVHWIDKKWIYPGEIEAGTMANPTWHTLMNKIDRLLERR